MLWMGGPDMLVMLAQRLYSATTSFPLLAIPFFILAGNLMNTGGMTHRIFDFTQLLVGRARGGLAHVNVLGSMIFAGMSGSAVADAAGLGVIEIAAMKKEGYSTRFAAALTCASCTVGPIIPPSIPFVIYGNLAEVSVGALFLGGIVPGLLMGGAMMLAILLRARRLNLPRSMNQPSLRQAMCIAADAVPAILDARHHHGRNPARRFHPDRGGGGRRALRAAPRVLLLPRTASRGSRGDICW